MRLQVVVDDFIAQLMDVLYRADHLSNDEFCLFLWNLLMLLQVEREIWSFAVLQDGAEGTCIDLLSIVKLHYIWMRK